MARPCWTASSHPIQNESVPMISERQGVTPIASGHQGEALVFPSVQPDSRFLLDDVTS